MQRAAMLAMLTDYLLALAAAIVAGLLVHQYRYRRRHQISMLWWAGGFGALTVAALAAGTYHGGDGVLGDGVRAFLWKLTVYAAGVFSFAALMGSIVGCVSGQTRFRFIALNVAVLLVYCVWMVTHDGFQFVVYDSVFAMVGVLGLHLAYGNREPSTPWMVTAVVVSAVAAVVQATGFGIRPLDHNDLYHLIQIIGVYLFYRGALLLRDRGLA